MADRRREFRDVQPLTHQEVLDRVRSQDPLVVAETLVAVGLFEGDYEFASRIVGEALTSDDRLALGAALIATAHIARIHRRVPVQALTAVRDALLSSDDYVRGQAETAADDIEDYVDGVMVRSRDCEQE